MKIALSANSSWYIYNFRKNLIKSLVDLDHDVIVIAPKDNFSEKLVAIGITYIPLPLSPRGTSPIYELWTLIILGFHLFQIKPDFVFSFTIKSNLYSGLWNRISNFKLIVNISGLGEAFEKQGLLNKVVKILYRISLKKVTRIFFQNNEDLFACVQQRLVIQEKCLVLPGSGIDLKTFVPQSQTTIANRTVFLMFGRLLPLKGYNLFIEAAKILKSRYKQSEYWILGIPDSRPESVELLKHILAASEEGIIRYIEATDKVLPVIQQSSVVVLPSLYNEGIPRSLIESIACGKPIITTNWRGCKEVVDGDKNGFLIDPTCLTSQELAKCMEKILIMPENEFLEMSKNSRLLAEKKFDEGIVLSAYHNELNTTN